MSVDVLMKKINDTFGEDTISYCIDGGPRIVTTSSGSLTMDLALGGGIADGRVIEYFGPPMGGKTTLAYLLIAEKQKKNDGYAVFVDCEHAMNKELAAQYGVDINRLIYINPKTAENAVDCADALIRSGQVRIICFDSVSAMVPTKIIESSAEQQTMALLARFMSTTMQKLVGIAYEHNSTLLFINQIRDKVGGYAPNGIIPTITPGGRAIPFYSTQRVNIKMDEYIKVKNEIVGHKIKIRVIKNKIAVPFKEATFSLLYGKGVDVVDEIAQVSVLAGFVVKAGSWYRIIDQETGEIRVHEDKELKFQGMDKFKQFLQETPTIAYELEQLIRGAGVEMDDCEREDEEGYGSAEAIVGV